MDNWIRRSMGFLDFAKIIYDRRGKNDKVSILELLLFSIAYSLIAIEENMHNEKNNS